MKHWRGVFLILLVLCLLCGCGELRGNDEGTFVTLSSEESTEYVIWTESLEYKVSDEQICVSFKRVDGMGFNFYEPYNIYKLVDDQWELLSFQEEHPFHSRQYFVKKENSSADNPAEGFQYIYFKDLQIKPSEGKYKVVKEFEGKSASCEFAIN